MKIVGLVGPKRSGKDTAAAALVEQRGYVRVGFADAVKELALRINPIVSAMNMYADHPHLTRLSEVVESQGWESAKSYPEVRRFLQELGTGVRDIVGAEALVDAWWHAVLNHSREDREAVVVPDVRFLNEADRLGELVDFRITRHRVLLIRVYRPMQDDGDRHVSETEQLGIKCDLALVNDGTPDQLHAKVLAAVDEWGG